MIPASLGMQGAATSLHGLETPLQLTSWLFWLVTLLALAVGITYVFLLIWTLGRHISHEPLARTRYAPPRPRSPPRNH